MVERTLISFPSQLQLIERLQHLLYLSSSMIFISGEKGSGKSTLIEQLSNQLPNKTQQAFITLIEPTSVAQLRLKIISQLFVQPLFDADDSLFNSLLLLKDKQASDITRVVVIDNIELLPESLINELAEVIAKKSLLTDNEINFILLADELQNNQLVKQIKQSLENQSIAALSFKLPPLAINEAQQLLSHSLDQVNYIPQVQHQDALAKQLLTCQGIPEKILQLATEVSSGNFEENKPSWLKTRSPAILLMFALVMIATSFAVYLYPKFVKPEIKIDIITEIDNFSLDEITSTNLIAENLSIAQSTEVLAGKWSNREQAITDTELAVGVADTEERITISDSQLFEMTYSGSLATTGDTSTKSDDLIKKDKVILSETEKQVSENEGNEEESDLFPTEIASKNPEVVIIVDDNSNEKTIEELIPTVNEGASRSDIELKASEEKMIVQEKIKKSGVEVSPQETANTAPVINGLFTSPDFLLAIDSDLYTLQLSGLSSEQSLQAFVKKYQLPQEDVYLYQTIRNGKAWYIIIYGQFESRSIAIQAAKNRPAIINKLDTWVKKYTTVHQDLTLNEQ